MLAVDRAGAGILPVETADESDRKMQLASFRHWMGVAKQDPASGVEVNLIFGEESVWSYVVESPLIHMARR